MVLIKKRNELDVNVRLKMLVYGQAGMGKAQPLYARVLTPTGYKLFSEIKVGDKVMGRGGNVQTVEGVFPQGVRAVYRIVTNDGAVTYCSDEHIWNVRLSNGNSRKAGFKNMTLNEMLEKGILCPQTRHMKETGRASMARFEIPVCEAMEFPAKELPIDPYITGVLIGDGSLTGNVACFSNPDVDDFIAKKVAKRLPSGYLLKRDAYGSCPRYLIELKEAGKGLGFIDKVKELGLNVHSKEKFIPQQYIYSSHEQRLDLLRGLMDTDGSANDNRVSYSTTSQQLAQDVVELVNSLGGIAKVHYYEREDGKFLYVVNVRTNENPFSLERKGKEWRHYPISRYITDATKIEDSECVCIKVSNNDELYITDGYIVTHNTTLALSAPKPLLVDFDGGVNRVDYDFIKDTVQVEKYEDILSLLNENDLSPYETIIIDTGGKLLDAMGEYIIRLYPKMAKRNGSLTLEGYGQRKREFTSLMKLIDSKKKNIVFVAHRQTEKNGEQTRYVPLFGGSNYDSLATELDLIGYLVADDRKRTITFDPTSESEGKNTCNMPAVMDIPLLKDAQGNVVGENNFLEEKVFKAYRQRLVERSVEGEAYKKLIAEIEDDIAIIADADAANNYIQNVKTGYEHIGNSLAVARTKFMKRVADLGLVFNKENKCYEQAPAAEGK